MLPWSCQSANCSHKQANAAEHVTSIWMALKNKMELTIGICVGSSIVRRSCRLYDAMLTTAQLPANSCIRHSVTGHCGLDVRQFMFVSVHGLTGCLVQTMSSHFTSRTLRCADQKIDLLPPPDFLAEQTVTLFVSVLLVNLLIQDGKSNYMEGLMLIALYLVIGLACSYAPWRVVTMLTASGSLGVIM